MRGDVRFPEETIREGLLARLKRKQYCTHVDEFGRHCTNTPALHVPHCYEHGGSAEQAEQRKSGSVLLDVMKACLKPEDARRLELFHKHGPSTLEDLIALLRLRVSDAEKRHRDGFSTLAEYGAELRSLTDQIRRMTESNSKIILNEALANRNDAPSTEAFNPFAHFPPPQKAGE